MTLRPCSECRRHITQDERTCPFCGAATVLTVARMPRLAGRLSRAAVFAGATLAGCYTSAPASQGPPPPPPPPPDDQQQQQVMVEPPPPPPDERAFAKPPAGAGHIHGIVTDSSTGRPRGGIHVQLHVPGQRPVFALTNANGEYAFRDLAAGTYTVIVEHPPPNHPRAAMPPAIRREVQLADGAVERFDARVTQVVVPVDRGPCCKPYGAPPARRRLV